MGVKKTAKAEVPLWKPVAVIGGAIIGALVIIFGVLYAANRPNYRDLEKEFKRISANIPSDWTFTSKNEHSGTFGVFCLGIDDSFCPLMIYEYRVSQNIKSEVDALTKAKEFITRSGFDLTNGSYQKCEAQDIASNDYSCSSSGRKGNIEAIVTLSSKNSRGKIGSWALVSISSYEE